VRRIKPPSGARSRYVLAESRVTRQYAAVLRLLGGPFARLGLRVSSIEFRRPELLLDAWREFQEGRARLILAFRHPYGDEPQVLSYAFDSALRKEARRLGFDFRNALRARFVHGFEVPLWSGPVVRWILPRSGAMPVYHSKIDRPSLEFMRATLSDGPYPIALAPEGQISYRSETLPRIEEGAARMGIWCVGDLAAAGRPERVLLLPLSVHYRYDESDARELESLLSELEAYCGAAAAGRGPRSAPDPSDPGWRIAAADRIKALDIRLIAAAEGYYGIRPGAGASRDQRLDALLEVALRRAEEAFGIEPEGDRINRVYRIRQEGWDRRYPEEDLRSLSPLERRLADRRAGEAWYVMRHMELVDLCHYLDSEYLAAGDGAGPPFDRLVEAAYSAGDLAWRLVGGDITTRPSVLAKKAIISASPPIDVGAKVAECGGDRRAASRAALSALEGAYIQEIKEFIDERIER
jgi:hypothetical protein